MKTHTKTKDVEEFCCEHCNTSYARKDSLLKHNEAFHESKKVNSDIGFGVFEDICGYEDDSDIRDDFKATGQKRVLL